MATEETSRSEDAGLTVFLIVLVLCLFVLFPLIPSGWGHVLTSVGFTLILVSGAFIVVERRALRLLAIVSLGVGLLTEWLSHAVLHEVLQTARHGSLMLFLVLVTFCLFAQVLKDGRVTPHRVRGAIAIYLLLGLVWSQAYAVVDLWVPDSFDPPILETSEVPSRQRSMPALVYFSYVTLTTLGYGDIQPTSGAARSLSIVEALVGQLFLAVLIARLVSLEIAHSMGGNSSS